MLVFHQALNHEDWKSHGYCNAPMLYTCHQVYLTTWNLPSKPFQHKCWRTLKFLWRTKDGSGRWIRTTYPGYEPGVLPLDDLRSIESHGCVACVSYFRRLKMLIFLVPLTGLEPVRCLHRGIFGAEYGCCPHAISTDFQQVPCVYLFHHSGIFDFD